VSASVGPLLAVRDLVVEYRPGGGLSGAGPILRAADRVSFEVHRGRTLGMVGESGSGKSTVARAIVGLAEAASGSICFDGIELVGLPAARRRRLAGRLQLLFQDPAGSLDPRVPAGEAIWEAPAAAGLGQWRSRRRELAAGLLARVGLGADAAGRYPHEFSGGQRQRLALARALAMEPELLVLDEPTSALDVSVAAQMLNLLADLQAEGGLGYLLIGHDLAAVEKVADRIAVMYAGQVVELAEAAVLLAHPRHPYTRLLLEAAAGARARPSPAELRGAAGEPGCRFAPRCPAADGGCAETAPELLETSAGHFVRCPRSG
jgi:oligopeptide/dipeptide ABC transporter ATP-binding protein